MEKNIRNRLFTRRALITGGLMVAILAANAVTDHDSAQHTSCCRV
jgi:conjugal transfer pilin signal peptidase TrbI